MRKKKTYAVFGLGRYGTAVAKELVNNGMEIIAVDIDQKIVDEAASDIPICKCADISDPDVIDNLDIGSIDTVIICMAGNLEASIMAVTLCKEAGAKTVIAKCANEMHKKILLKIGADEVVIPETESGIRLADNLLCSGFIDMVALSDDVSIVEIDVKDEWCGKNLIELDLRKKYGINIVAVKKENSINININPEQALEEDSSLIVIANTSKLSKL